MENSTTTTLEGLWREYLEQEFSKSYMKSLKAFLKAEKAAKKIIYPKNSDIFKAFELTPFEKVKVVILGQDPYHGVGQAHGLCFSVKKDVRIPPSLLNIYKELQTDLNIPLASHGCLESWGKQGVLLLNSVLTVESGLAASHQGKGWEQFTDQAIIHLSSQKTPLAFILWGAYAQKKGAMIDASRHCVIKSHHPSPLSAHRGFFGSRPFSKINTFLEKNGQKTIDWRLPDQA
jgi:uracil-DNA glycosylase